MQISINIDDNKLSELVSKGIEEIDRETLGKIVNEALKEVFKDEEVVRTMLFEKSTDYYGKTRYGGLHDWVQEAMAQAVTESDYAEFKSQVYAIVKEHGQKMLLEVLTKTLVSNLFNYDNQMEFLNRIRSQLIDDVRNSQ